MNITDDEKDDRTDSIEDYKEYLSLQTESLKSLIRALEDDKNNIINNL